MVNCDLAIIFLVLLFGLCIFIMLVFEEIDDFIEQKEYDRLKDK